MTDTDPVGWALMESMRGLLGGGFRFPEVRWTLKQALDFPRSVNGSRGSCPQGSKLSGNVSSSDGTAAGEDSDSELVSRLAVSDKHAQKSEHLLTGQENAEIGCFTAGRARRAAS